jgi:hypothetical protein
VGNDVSAEGSKRGDYCIYYLLIFYLTMLLVTHTIWHRMTGRMKKVDEDEEESYRDPVCLERARLMKITKSSVRRVAESTAMIRCVHLPFQPSVAYPPKTSVI